MSGTKISALTSATSLTGTETFPVVQSGGTKKAAVSLVRPSPVTFTPSFSATTAAPTYTLATDDDFSTTFYGNASYGVKTDDGVRVEEWGRIITGSQFGTFDEGEGSYYIPLQATPHELMTGGIGEGQIVIVNAGGAALSTVTWEIDPVLDMIFLGETPGDATVMWGFLDGVDWNSSTIEMVVGAANPDIATTRLILAWHVSYLKAT